FVFYLISSSQAVFQEIDSAIISDGTFSAQTTTPISSTALAGDYVLGWNGAGSAEEDYVGQASLSSSGGLTGMTDFNQFSTGRQFFNVLLNGNLSLGGDGTQANDFTANLQTNRSEEHTSELQSLAYLVCRLLLEKKKKKKQ